MVEPKDYIGWKSENGNLEILNIFKDAKGYYKAVVKCSVCAKDDLLFPEGIFTSHLHDILRGVCPCGCSKSYRWSKEQYLIKIQRKCETINCYLVEIPIIINAFVKIKIKCNIHNTENFIVLHRFLNDIHNPNGCDECSSANKRKSVETVVRESGKIEKLLQKLPTGSEINRVVDGSGNKATYYFKCGRCSEDEYTKNGVCSGIFKTSLNRLARGEMPCRCSKSPNYTEDQRLYKVNKLLKEFNFDSYIIHRDRYIGKSTYFTWHCGACGKEHKTTYHNFINKGSRCQIFDMNRVTYVYLSDWIDYENIKPFIKVGITHNIKNRIKEQQSVTKSLFKNIEYFKFNTLREALYVESLLLKTFPGGYVSKQEFEDGYTETISPIYRSIILNILQRLAIIAAEKTKDINSFIEVAEELFIEICEAEQELREGKPVVEQKQETKQEMQEPTIIDDFSKDIDIPEPEDDYDLDIPF